MTAYNDEYRNKGSDNLYHELIKEYGCQGIRHNSQLNVTFVTGYKLRDEIEYFKKHNKDTLFPPEFEIL